MARTVSIGVQDFEKIISKNNFYVDKTYFIKDWWESDDEVTLITRPRRFGKTLNMNMIERFFSVKFKEQGEIFRGLNIWKEEKYRELQGTYPVIFLSFAGVKENNYDLAAYRICDILQELYTKNYFLLDSEVLTNDEKNMFKKMASCMGTEDAATAVHRLSDYMCRYYGKKAIILLDEYDTPMQEAFIHGYWDELVSLMRSMFNLTFKTNPYLERAIMTGITRITKESIFSDLNNLKVVTTTSSKYAKCFGFTEDEVFAALDEFGLSGQKNAVKQWYDGFTFGNISDIYNPWSIISYLDTKEFDIYWANTSSNGLVNKLIREGDEEIKQTMEELLNGKSLVTDIDEQIVFSQLDNSISAVWSLLLTSGYLKVLKYTFDTSNLCRTYELALTNTEVLLMFRSMIKGWFSDRSPEYNKFVKALLLDDKRAMNSYMNKVALKTFSSFDTGNHPSEYTEPERFYHGFVLGLMVDLSDRYSITSNRESGFGRYDVMLEPKKISNDTNTTQKDNAIIIEFKVHDSDDEATLKDTVSSALAQIEDKKYDQILIAKGIPADCIRKYGFAFEGKKVLIG